MRKTILFLMIALMNVLLFSCEKETTKLEVTFNLNPNEFIVSETDFNLKNTTSDIFDSFEHKYLGAKFTLTNENDVRYSFNTNINPIDSFLVTLPIGTYSLSGNSIIVDGSDDDEEHYYFDGLKRMKYDIPEQDIVITEATTAIDIDLNPKTTLILIADQDNVIDTTIIKYDSEGYYENWKYKPFHTSDNLLYSYIDDENTQFTITKNNDNTLTMYNSDLNIGSIYKINVTDGKNEFNVNPDFTEENSIDW